MREQLGTLAAVSQQLSEAHRLNFPSEPVFERLREVLGPTRVLFQDWTLEICFLLEHVGVLRYGQLKSKLPGISTRTLAAKLAQLQQHGLVTRRIFNKVPPHVEYELTEKGRHFTQSVFPLLVVLHEQERLA
ncbi:MAG TPA: winged helix-turn-helix transcriptional regulator [Candidatus Thermoplasmatota archaeon]|nr:winged helix-turn-helix transcriptional regulator [Candidatus Thermoplasmatota archaeon]